MFLGTFEGHTCSGNLKISFLSPTLSDPIVCVNRGIENLCQIVVSADDVGSYLVQLNCTMGMREVWKKWSRCPASVGIPKARFTID